jgi:ATP-dependent helicase/nuclease subunit A
MSETEKNTPTKEQRQAADPARSVWVAANAGSGKTQVLVDRVVRLLLQGADPQSILCLTYTKAAAAEMANRLFERLSAWVGMSDMDLDDEIWRLSGAQATAKSRSLARTLFTRALETPGGLKIQTIHGFCERLLQLFPVESAMAPGFRVLDDKESAQLFRDALLASLTDDVEVWNFLDTSGVRTLDDLEALAKPFLSGTTGMRQRLSDFSNLTDVKGLLRSTLNVLGDESIADIEALLCDINELDYHTAIKTFTPYGPYSKYFACEIMQRALIATAAGARSAALAELVLTGKGEPRGILLSKAAREENLIEANWLEHERHRILDLLERLALQETLNANLSLYRAMALVLAKVNSSKRAKGLYDFDDLIAKTAHLLESYEAAQWVLYKLDKGLTHILVDEAQDTSPAQWRTIKALAGAFFTEEQRQHPRTVFAVGDIKQSIFSFQGADISSFEATRQDFMSSLTAIDDKLDVVDLSVSYRSAQVVLDSVDQVFAEGQFPRSGFGSRAAEERQHTAHFKDRLGMVEVWDVVRPDHEEELDHWQAPVDKPTGTHHRLKLAERIAVTVKSWINTRKLSGHDRAVTAGDILILLQRRSTLFNAVIGALRRHGVPVAGADRLVVQNSLVVKDLQALGHVLAMPDDDHALACFLKSPLAAKPLNEEQIFTLAYDRGTTPMLQRLSPDDANRLQLEKCLASTDTPFMLFAKLIQQSKQRILERLGPEGEDAAQEFLNLALDYEQQTGTSLSGFLDWLAEGETQIKREMDQNSGQVRIMTVHGAKGLEAPIVIMADATDAPRTPRNKFVPVNEGNAKGLQIFKTDTLMKPAIITQLSDADATLRAHENMRLMYVAMTRAADELYVCGSHTNDKLNAKSWYVNIKEALLANGSMREIASDPDLMKWRLGAEPQKIVVETEALQSKTEIPAWAIQPLAHKQQATQTPTAPRNSDQFDREAVQRGIAIHRLIELMADAPAADRLALGQRWAAKLDLPDSIAIHLNRALQLPNLQKLFGLDGQSEVTVHGIVDGLGVVHGRVDRLAVTADEVMVLDYKTNRIPPLDLGVDHPYTQQMSRYTALLSQAYPGHSLKAGVLWTQTGRVYWLSPALLTQSLDQQRQLQALTRDPIITTS